MLRTALPTLLALGFLSVPAAADTPAALRADLGALAAEAAQLRGVQLAQADSSQLANITVRLSRMEEELRRLTGRLERLEYGRDQAQDRLDRLVADMDVRLSRIEGGAAGQRAELPVEESAPEPEPEQLRAPEPPAAVAAPAPVTAPRTTARAAPSPQDDSAARRGYVLGTLPRDAIMGDGTAAGAATGGAGAPPRAVAPEPQRQAALPRPDTPKGRYDAALALLQAGDFGSAQDEFADFLSDYPKDPLAPSAAYWLAETHYVQRDFAGAASQFAKNFQTYGESATKAPDNLLKMGMSLSQLGQRAEACRVFDELASRFPNAAPPIRQAAARGRAGAGCG